MATEVQSGRYNGLEAPELVAAYRNIYLSRRIDDKEIQLKRQNKIYFQINSAGHEAVTTAAGMVARPAYDWFDLYYRDRAFCLQIGVTPYEMFLQAVGAREIVPVSWVVDARLVSARLRGWRENDLGAVDYTRVRSLASSPSR